MKIIKTHIILIISVLSITGCFRYEELEPEPEGKIIILMYHRISAGEALNLYERSASNFQQDLEYLKKNKINIIDFNDLLAIKESGKMPAGNSAILTFDDGDNSWFNIVQPILKQYRVKATFFLWVHMIGKDSFLSWQDVELMSNYTLDGGVKPFTFGSHSYSHPFLYGSRENYSDPDEYKGFLDYEFRESKRIIEEYVPGNVEIFALPFGDGAGDENIIAAAKRHGYKFIRTSVHGTINTSDSDLFLIPALPILDNTESNEIGIYLGL